MERRERRERGCEEAGRRPVKGKKEEERRNGREGSGGVFMAQWL